MTLEASIKDLLGPFAGKTGIYHAVADANHDIDGSYVTRKTYHVYKDGVQRVSFSYTVRDDDVNETERERKKAFYKAKKCLEFMNAEEGFVE